MEAKKILLVEDDPNFGAVLKDYLMINDFEVTLAKNGMEGFEKFKKDTYDLCILDVMMPYKDGYTLAKEIREKNNEVPIIFLTAKSMKEDVLKGYKAGADDYLSKPFHPEELQLRIQSLLRRARGLGAGRAVPGPALPLPGAGRGGAHGARDHAVARALRAAHCVRRNAQWRLSR